MKLTHFDLVELKELQRLVQTRMETFQKVIENSKQIGGPSSTMNVRLRLMKTIEDKLTAGITIEERLKARP